VLTWLDKQGHDRCWYYPDLFNQLVNELGVKPSVEPKLPSWPEFVAGCYKYQQEQYPAEHTHVPLKFPVSDGVF